MEEHIVIGNNREINVPDSIRRIAVQNDNLIETVTFDCPRYWDNHDLSKMYIYIIYKRNDGVIDEYMVDNIRVDNTNSNIIHFDWTISDAISEINGRLDISVGAKKTLYAENYELRWYSEINSQMRISQGFDNSENVRSEYPDIINDLLTRMDGVLSADTPILDKSLTIPNLAAESKSVGDAIYNSNTQLTNKINTDINNSNIQLTNKIDTTKNDLQSQINSLASGSPLVASSTTEMTNTTKVYVNTSDGHWYYYNGTSWTDGGVYQATEIQDESITGEKISDELLLKNYIYKKSISGYASSVLSDNSCTIVIDTLNDISDYDTLYFNFDSLRDDAQGIQFEKALGLYEYDTNGNTLHRNRFKNTSGKLNLDNATKSIKVVLYVYPSDNSFRYHTIYCDNLILKTNTKKSYVLNEDNIDIESVNELKNQVEEISDVTELIHATYISYDKILNASFNSSGIDTEATSQLFKELNVSNYNKIFYSCDSVELEVETQRQIYLGLYEYDNNGTTLKRNRIPVNEILKGDITLDSRTTIIKIYGYLSVGSDSLLNKTLTINNLKLWADNNFEYKLNDSVSISIDQIIGIEEKSDIPEYYKQHIQNKINTINYISENIGTNGDGFIFITDVHRPTNSNHSPLLIKEIIDKAPAITNVVFGGDIFNARNTQEQALKDIRDFANDYKDLNIDLKYVFGNHETNKMGQTTIYDRHLTEGQVYSIIGKPLEKYVDTNKSFYYYYDNPTQKIRYIVLDTFDINGNFGNGALHDQRAWLMDLLSNTPDGYKIGIFVHWLFSAAKESVSETLTLTNPANILKAMLDAVKNKSSYTISERNWNFSNKNLDIMFVMCGHCHRDYVYQDENSYPIIATTTDNFNNNYDDVSVTRTEGTITEQAFDAVQVDTENRTIYLTRIGGGADREFTY